MKQKKVYEKPQMKVYELKQRSCILAGSTEVEVSRGSYQHGRTDPGTGTSEEIWY